MRSVGNDMLSRRNRALFVPFPWKGTVHGISPRGWELPFPRCDSHWRQPAPKCASTSINRVQWWEIVRTGGHRRATGCFFLHMRGRSAPLSAAALTPRRPVVMGDEDHAPRLPHEGQESAREAGASSLSEAGRGSWPEEDSEDGWDDIRVDATPGGHLGDMLPSTKRTIAAMLHSTASQRGIVAHRVAEPTSPPRPSSPRDLGGGDFQGRRSSEGSVSQLSDSFTRGSSGPGDPDGHGDMLQARRAGDGGEHGASHGGPSDATVMAVEVNFMGAGQTTKITVDPPPSRGELGRSGRRLIAPASSDTHGQPGPSSSTSSSVGLEERGTQRTNVNRKRFSFRRRIGAETHRKAAIFADNWDSDFKKNTMRMYSKNSRGPSRGEDGSAARTGSEADEDAVRVSQLKEGGLEEGTDKPHTGEEQSTLALFNRPFEAEALMLEAVDALEDLTARFAAIDKDPRWKINPNPLPLLPKVELPKREDKVHAKQIKRVEDAEIPAELAGQLDAWALPSPPNVEVMQVHAKALAKWVRARFEPHMREFVFAETNKREICGMAVSSFWAIHAVHFHRKSPAWHHARTNPVRGCFLAFVELYAFRILNFIERGRAPTVKDRLVEDALAECVANSTLEMFRHAFPQSSHRFKDPFSDVGKTPWREPACEISLPHLTEHLGQRATHHWSPLQSLGR